MEGIIYAAARELYDLRDGVEVTLLGSADDASADHDVRDVDWQAEELGLHLLDAP